MWTDKIDWELLRAQQREFIDFINDTDLPQVQLDAFDGILNFIDYIQDIAAIEIGEETVFGKSVEG